MSISVHPVVSSSFGSIHRRIFHRRTFHRRIFHLERFWSKMVVARRKESFRRSSIMNYEQSVMFGQYREQLASFARDQAMKKQDEMTGNGVEFLHGGGRRKGVTGLCLSLLNHYGEWILLAFLGSFMALISFLFDLAINSCYDCKYPTVYPQLPLSLSLFSHFSLSLFILTFSPTLSIPSTCSSSSPQLVLPRVHPVTQSTLTPKFTPSPSLIILSCSSTYVFDGEAGMEHKLLDQIFNLDFISTWNDPDFGYHCTSHFSPSSRIRNFGNESYFERNRSSRIPFIPYTFCQNSSTSNRSWIWISYWETGLFFP